MAKNLFVNHVRQNSCWTLHVFFLASSQWRLDKPAWYHWDHWVQTVRAAARKTAVRTFFTHCYEGKGSEIGQIIPDVPTVRCIMSHPWMQRGNKENITPKKSAGNVNIFCRRDIPVIMTCDIIGGQLVWQGIQRAWTREVDFITTI